MKKGLGDGRMGNFHSLPDAIVRIQTKTLQKIKIMFQHPLIRLRLTALRHALVRTLQSGHILQLLSKIKWHVVYWMRLSADSKLLCLELSGFIIVVSMSLVCTDYKFLRQKIKIKL